MFTVPAAELVRHSALAAVVENNSPMPLPHVDGSAVDDAGMLHAAVMFACPVAQFVPVPCTNLSVVAVAVVEP